MAGKVSITVGLPGSGKTTEATLIMHNEGRDKVELVSRDDLRHLLYRSEGILNSKFENRISKVQKDIVKGALKEGKHVIVHDLNLRERYRRQWAEVANQHGAEFEIIDLTQVPLETCVARNQVRKERGERYVPEQVIRDMASKFKDVLKKDVWKPYKLYPSNAWAEKLNVEPVPDLPGKLPFAVIVDIDGTVADCTEVRNPYDTSLYHLDKPKHEVIRLVRELHYGLGLRIIFVSGRHQDFRDVTEAWLNKHVKVPIEALHMRYESGTEDSVIKLQLFNTYIRNKYNVYAVLDDRNRVVEMWRSLGLLVLQVQDGDF